MFIIMPPWSAIMDMLKISFIFLSNEENIK